MSEIIENHKVILANGIILNNCDCGYYEKTLICFLHDYPFGQAFQYFSNPENYKTVIFDLEYTHYTDRIEYSGFTEIKSIIQRENSVDVAIEGSDIKITESRIYKEKVGVENNGTVYYPYTNQP